MACPSSGARGERFVERRRCPCPLISASSPKREKVLGLSDQDLNSLVITEWAISWPRTIGSCDPHTFKVKGAISCEDQNP